MKKEDLIGVPLIRVKFRALFLEIFKELRLIKLIRWVDRKLAVKSCKGCLKLWTKYCPIRVAGRNEGNMYDVDIEKDYCSRYIKKGHNNETSVSKNS